MEIKSKRIKKEVLFIRDVVLEPDWKKNSERIRGKGRGILGIRSLARKVEFPKVGGECGGAACRSCRSRR